jgi:DNA polymerase-3 subunit gamma/tau
MAAPAPEMQVAPALRIMSFNQLVALAGEKRDLLTKGALEGDVRLVRFEDGRLEIALEPHASKTLITDLGRKLEQWTNRRWTVVVSNAVGQPTLRSVNQAAKQERERTAEADARVQAVLARFPGAKVIEVRRLAPELPEPTDNADYGSEDLAESSDSDDL